MNKETGRLFSPIKIGPLRLKNRIIKPATNEGMAKGGLVSKGLARFHERIAAGGASLSTVAYCAIDRDGRTFVDQVTMDNGSLRDFRILTDGVHKNGAAASAQLTHAGSFTFLPKEEFPQSRAISASGGFNKVGVLTKRYFKRPLDRDGMDTIADQFVSAAKYAREAGFDAVELHMGHGYLLSQFISPLYNSRQDAFGGSLENRMRFPADVLSRVLDAIGRDLAVIVKYSMTDGKKGGNGIEDGVAIAKILEKTGAHLAVLSNGLNVESIQAMFGSPLPPSSQNVSNPIVKLGMKIQSMTVPPDTQFRETYLRDLAREVRQSVSIPLSYLGGVQSYVNAKDIIADGFDCIALGRTLIHDPNIIN
ncbi:MAG: NADH:flavin oxidoreductase, partial [Pseudomonadota bacterium]